MSFTRIFLKTKKDQSLRRFHPWVFSGAIKKTEGVLHEGDTVEVYSNRGEYLGTGHYQVGSIAVKLFAFEPVNPNVSFWREKIRKAFELRKNAGLTDTPHNNVFRLVHAEGDYLPGLIADFYNGTLVLKTSSIGMHLIKEELTEIFKETLGNRLVSVYDKSSGSIPEEAGLNLKNGYLWGEKVAFRDVMELGCRYRVNWETGQKTGFFIDQRENRNILGQYAKGKKILNTFCYSGGFSVSALKAGAETVHSLDSSASALELAKENIVLNGFRDRDHKCIRADATEYIKNMEEDYDLIVLDPPAFAKHQSARHNAVQGYKRLNAHAIKHIKPGGLLITFSCSQAVDKYLFNHTLTAAAISAGRKVRILQQLHQPSDHPVNIFHPEGEYLKGLVLHVE